MDQADEALIEGISCGRFLGRLADPDVTGQLIADPIKRRQWLELVQALQLASESENGPLKDWVFHGSYGQAIRLIEEFGLEQTHARVVEADGSDLETTGNHFGTANVAAFFAEDGIESTGDPEIDLAIFAVPLRSLERLGDFRADAYMIETPLTSRLRSHESEVMSKIDAGIKSWQGCWNVLETLVVLADIPPSELVCLRRASDVLDLICSLSNEAAAEAKPRKPVMR